MESRTEAPPKPAGAPDARGASGAPVAEEPSTTSRRRPPVWLLVVIGILVIAGLIYGIKFLIYALGHESTDDARVDADTVAITSKIGERVDRVLVDTNQAVTKGQVLVELDAVDERSRLTAAVANRQAQLAQARAAQTNVELTTATQAAQNQQNSGEIASAQAAILNASASATSAQEQVAAAKAAVAQAQAQLRVAQSNVPSAREGLVRANADLNRTTALVRTGDLAQQTLDADRALQAQAQAQYRSAIDTVSAAETAVTQAQARYTAAIASANAAEAGIGSQRGQLTTAQGRYDESSTPFKIGAEEAQYAAAQAQVKSLDAQVRTAQDQLGYTVIRSPIDGYVGAKNIEIGATVAPGQSLLDIVPRYGTYITANYKETQLGKIRVGQDVDIKVDAYKGTTFHGKVQTIAPASQNTFSLVPAQNATGNFVKVTQRLPIRIIVTDPPAAMPLRVGMSVETYVDTKSQ
ncbi:MAG: HlyD family secretion protein [Candidatus Velthaea sp.]